MTPATLDPFVESQIEAFEKAMALRSDTDLRDFLPPRNHEKFSTTLMELVRVDLELAWSRGQQRSVEDYQASFPELFADADRLEQLAFDEFRLRRGAGETIDIREYESRFHIRACGWDTWVDYDTVDAPPQPTVPATEGDAAEREREATQRYDHSERRNNTSPGELPPGSSWNGFTIECELGQGAFGTTYLARQQALANRRVVLKCTPTRSDEVQRLAQLQHTNIVPVYSVAEYEGQTVICMPYQGKSTFGDLISAVRSQDNMPSSGKFIADQLRRSEPDSGEDNAIVFHRFFDHETYARSVVWLIAQLADGLEHSHRRGVLHRDIKPANILLGQDGEPQLLDFNLAITTDHSAVEMSLAGTLPYMSPEQLELFVENEMPAPDEMRSHEDRAGDEDRSVDVRSDIYALGVVFHELLTGHLPYRTDHFRQGTIAHQAVTLLAEQRKPIDVPQTVASPAVAACLKKCLAFRKDDRYQSAEELRDDLRGHLEDLPLKYARNTSFRELCGKWARRHPRLCSWAGAGVLLVLMSVLALTAWSIRETQLQATKASARLDAFSRAIAELRPQLTAIGSDAIDAASVTTSGASLAGEFQISDPARVAENTLNFLSPPQREEWAQHAASLGALLANAKSFASTRTSDEQEKQKLRDEAHRLESDWRPTGTIRPSSTIQAQQLRDTQPTGDFPNRPNRRGQRRSMPGGAAHLRDLDIKSAESSFREAVRMAPQDAASWLLLAQVLVKKGDYAGAIACFDICESLIPASVVPTYERGLCQLLQNNYANASPTSRSVIERRPEIHGARLNRALALIGLQQTRSQRCRTSIRPWPLVARKQGPISFVLGYAKSWEIDHKRGRITYKALQSTPRDEAGWLARGIARLTDQPELALEDFRQALALNPTSRMALHNIAHVQSEKLHDPQQAIEALNLALSIDDSDIMALAGRGVLQARLGQVDEALQDAERLLKMPIDAVTQYQVGCIFALANQHAAAANDDYGQRELSPLEKKALAAIATSLTRDWSLIELSTDDPDIASLRRSDEYQELLTVSRTMRDFSQGNPASRTE